MADDQETKQTHSEVDLDRNLRTKDDKVFFKGKAQVDQRTQNSIDKTIEEQDAKAEAGDEDEDDGNGLGDTRTSTEQKKAAAKKKNGRK